MEIWNRYENQKKIHCWGESPNLQTKPDSLRVWEENQIEVVECVECNYVETIIKHQKR